MQESLIKEGKENGPKLKIKIFFSEHISEGVHSMEEDYKNCDVFIPEDANWNPEREKEWNKLSQGKVKPTEFADYFGEPRFHSFLLTQSEMVFNSKKPILFIDAPEKYNILGKMEVMYEQYSKRIKSAKEFNDIFSATKDFLLERSELNKKRENIMKNLLPVRIKSFLEENSDYKKKKELRVLISLGGSHTRVFHNIKARGEEITREFRKLPLVYGVYSEIERRFSFGKDISRDLIAQYILHGLISSKLDNQFIDLKDDLDKMKLVDDVAAFVRSFNYEEIESIIGNGDDVEISKRKLNNLALSKNIKIPEFIK